ncbi:hypothetical protein OAR97_00885 [Arcobacteraceae bacterium]|nr:hypothetical protein [Arcobacteraceae bacterium]
MASDLSKIIQDSITLTLNGLLAKDANIIQITKTHIKDIEELQLLKVQSVFDFSNFTSEFSFLVPATSSSLIFNTMMGSPITELAEELDDDAEDAIGEFISNTSGTLTTSINGANFQDVGQTKFNIANKEIIQGNNLNDLESTYRFLIDLEGNELIIFITFDDVILPYIKEISESVITHHEEEVIEEIEETIIEEVPEVKEEPKIESTDEIKEIKKENQDEQEKEESTPEDKKDKKLKLIIYIIGAFLGLIIFSFLIAYFMGAFDQEPVIEKKSDFNSTKKIKDKNQLEIIKYNTLQKVIFKASDINKERLNNKLAALTKYNVLNKEELEAQKLAEKNRLFELEKEKELLAFSKKNQEETIFVKEEPKVDRVIEKKTKFKQETFIVEKDKITVTDNTQPISNELEKEEKKQIVQNTPTIEQQTTNIQNNSITDIISTKLSYVVTSSLKYSLFKVLVQETNTKQARISICNNENGKTAIYIGPFETIQLQQKMIDLVKKNNSDIVVNPISINEEEFNTRCNLE